MDNLKAMRERRVEAEEEMEALVRKAKMTAISFDEKQKFDALLAEIDKLDEDIKKAEGKENIIKKKVALKMGGNSRAMGEPETAELDEQDRTRSFDFTAPEILKRVPKSFARPISDFVLRNYDVPEEAQKASVENVIRSLCLGGRMDNATEAAIKTMKSAANGSATLTEFLSAQLWEKGLSKSHLARSGMQTFLMDEPTVRFPKITEYPALEWKGEGESTTERDVTISSVNGEAKTLRGWTSLSAELLQDGKNIENAIRRAFSMATGNAVDYAGLVGDGDDEPLGIENYTGVNVHTVEGDVENYDPWIDVIQMILEDDGEIPNTSIMSPAIWATLNKLKTETELVPLPVPKALENHRFLETSKPLSSKVFLGGFNSLHLGIRLDTQLIISPVISNTYTYNILSVFRGQMFAEREEDFGIIETSIT